MAHATTVAHSDALAASCAQAAGGLLARLHPPGRAAGQEQLAAFNEQQVDLSDRIEAERQKFERGRDEWPLGEMLDRTRRYHDKLGVLQREMLALSRRSESLKSRALKLQELKQAEALRRENRRQLLLEREEQLTAQPATAAALNA